MATVTDLEILFLERVNDARAEAGAPPLAFDAELLAAADAHTGWQISIGDLTHDGPGGTDAGDRIEAAGYGARAWAENVAVTTDRGAPGLDEADVERLHASLMDSPGHRANLLSEDYTEIGIGLEFGPWDGAAGAAWVTQVFGLPTAAEAAEPDDVDPPASPVEEPPTEEPPAEEPEPPVEEPPPEEPELPEPPVEGPPEEPPADPDTLTVGEGKDFATLAEAEAAATPGDTILVDAGTYTDQFVTFDVPGLTVRSVGGLAHFKAEASPDNGQGIFRTRADTTIDGFELSGAQVPDRNGAGIRVEDGDLTVLNSRIHGNQMGILANGGDDTITVRNSHVFRNGTGDGQSHNIYVNDQAAFVLMDSVVEEALGGHNVKSRAEANTITGNAIHDHDAAVAYGIDLPNGGETLIEGNELHQGANGVNGAIVSFGAEGSLRDGALTVRGNTVVNDLDGGVLVRNHTDVAATVTGNDVWGLAEDALLDGEGTAEGNAILAARPALSDEGEPPTEEPPTEEPPAEEPPAEEPEPPVVEPPPAPVDWNAAAAREAAWFDLTGSWGAPEGWEPGEDPPLQGPQQPEPGPVLALSWDVLAALVQANFAATGAWAVPEVSPPVRPEAPDPVDWDALAARAAANFAETGAWFV